MDKENCIFGTERDKFKILAVEDTDYLELLLKKSLNKIGFTNHTVVNRGFKALDEFAKGNYDLVILDIGLPDLNGFYLCASMKAIDQFRKNYTPIIALTAYGESVHQEACQAGSDMFMVKPYKIESLETNMITWLQMMTVKKQSKTLQS